ncbi:hypothetical protein GEMRC1_005972 [Eukaryota sp. GEM-RC1]
MVLVSSFLILVLVGSGFWISKSTTKPIFLFPLTKIFFELISSIFFLPFTITAFSHISCSDDSSFYAIPADQCWSTQNVFLKGLFLFAWSIIFIISLIRTSMFTDILPTSKRLFASLDRRFLINLLLVKVFLAISLTLFDHLPIVFTISFPLSGVFSSFYSR